MVTIVITITKIVQKEIFHRNCSGGDKGDDNIREEEEGWEEKKLRKTKEEQKEN